MKHNQRCTKQMAILFALVWLASGLAACRPAPASPTPDIGDVVATGMAGTLHARTLGTIVSATQAALAGKTQTAPPPSIPSPSAPAAQAAAPEDPCTAGGKGNRSAYVDNREGFCLFYPADFFVNKPGAGIIEFLGPALDKSNQPLRAYINVIRKEPVGGRTLDEIAMSTWKAPRSAYHLSNIQLDGQDALVASDLQLVDVAWKVKQIIFIHSGYVYLISISPFDSTSPYDKALPDAQRFWDLAIPSFTFR